MKTTVLILIFMLITAVARGDQFRLGVPDESAFFHSIAKVESKSAWAAVGAGGRPGRRARTARAGGRDGGAADL